MCDKQRNRKVWSIYRENKKLSIEVVPKETQTLDLLDLQGFKLAIINMFKEL